ncbi:hypothetical protein Tco_1158935, partial [Tanacetum coccineum]
DVIVNGDLEEEPAPIGDQSGPSAPKTAKQLAARRNQERVKSILLLAIPNEYLLKFHIVADAKSLQEAIKSRFGGNVESKKMQKNVLKHQFENFSTTSNESLDKAYDRFQKLISQLEVHGAPISKEDINQKFLRSLPSSWNQIALIMRNKPDIDEIDIDDLYNNLRVYEDELKRSSGSNSASQNLAFLSSENTSRLDEYAIRNKIIESQTTELNTKTSETAGQTNAEKPKSASESVVSNPKINRYRVIIEDLNSDDEEEEYEVQTVRPKTQTVKTRDDKSCNFHDKKSQEPKLKNVVNTGQREGKRVWDNTKRVNHQNFSKYPHLSKTSVLSGVLTRT